jgi:2-aminoadipate transaminase
VHLPDSLSTDELLPLACEEGVAFAPGNNFFPEGTAGQDWMRLNFAAQSEEEIEQGIRRLGKAIKRMKGGEEREENRE